jgi:hypothetical protein
MVLQRDRNMTKGIYVIITRFDKTFFSTINLKGWQ